MKTKLQNLKSYLLSLHAALTHQCDKHWVPLEVQDEKKSACPECEREDKKRK